MARINQITILAGKRGTGKTTFQKEKILKKNTKRTLIVDTFDHPSWREYDIIPISFLKGWKSGTYRVILTDTEKDLIEIAKHVNNCNIVFEDAKKYFTSSIPDKVKNIIIDSKQKNIDIYIMYHALSQVPKYLREMFDNLVIFKTRDSLEVAKRFDLPYEIIDIMKRVNKHKSPYYCEVTQE